MKPEPWGEALDAMEHLSPAPMTVVVPTPTGRVLDQDLAHDLSTRERLVFACGRYEGIDQRVLDHCAESYEFIEVSLGDYVLNGGEVAVLTITEAVVRLIPGVLGNPESLVEESHAPRAPAAGVSQLHETPCLAGSGGTPPSLLSGNHAAIATWRREQALERTRQRRPDLFQRGV